MKRDFDLIRSILIEIESLAPGDRNYYFNFPEFDRSVVKAHIVLLIEAGLVEGTISTPISGIKSGMPFGLTWDGHDFLDSIKDPTLWEKAKKNVITPAGGIAFSVLKQWAKAEAKRHLGF